MAHEVSIVEGFSLTKELVEKLINCVFEAIQKEHPNVLDYSKFHKPKNYAGSPIGAHPLFYGCFDWHSAVHSHWTILRFSCKLKKIYNFFNGY